MPRLAQVNLLGVLLAGLVIWIIGFVWYGLLFSEPYMNGIGVYFGETDGAVNWMMPEGPQMNVVMPMEPGWMAGGMIIPFVLAFGLGWLMKRQKVESLAEALSFGLVLSLLIGGSLMAYALVYTPWHSVPGFLVNASHNVATFVAGCAVLSFFK